MTNLAFNARIDQAQAGHDHLMSLLDEDVAAGVTTTFTPESTAAHMLRRLHLPFGIATGEIGFCAHAEERSEQPLFWFARKPSRVRCAPCAKRLSDRELKRPGKPRCDGCGKPRRGLRSVLEMAPMHANPTTGLVRGPVLVEHWLCSRCVPVPAAEAA